jgi:hypothetical protein
VPRGPVVQEMHQRCAWRRVRCLLLGGSRSEEAEMTALQGSRMVLTGGADSRGGQIARCGLPRGDGVCSSILGLLYAAQG